MREHIQLKGVEEYYIMFPLMFDAMDPNLSRNFNNLTDNLIRDIVQYKFIVIWISNDKSNNKKPLTWMMEPNYYCYFLTVQNQARLQANDNKN